MSLEDFLFSALLLVLLELLLLCPSYVRQGPCAAGSDSRVDERSLRWVGQVDSVDLSGAWYDVRPSTS